MKGLQFSSFPLNEAVEFTPSTVHYIRKLDSLALSVHDVWPKASLDDAAAATTEQPSIFEIRQKSIFSRVFTCSDPSGTTLAELSGPLLSYGHWKLAFPDKSPSSSHTIEQRPAGPNSRADVFVQESVPYFWDVEGARRRLFKVAGNKRVEIGQFISKNSRDVSGMLVVDDRQVDVIVALMTAVAVLKRNDSFRK